LSMAAQGFAEGVPAGIGVGVQVDGPLEDE
jgi:hypothetical protein